MNDHVCTDSKHITQDEIPIGRNAHNGRSAKRHIRDDPDEELLEDDDDELEDELPELLKDDDEYDDELMGVLKDDDEDDDERLGVVEVRVPSENLQLLVPRAMRMQIHEISSVP
jgi:hypothetical protein